MEAMLLLIFLLTLFLSTALCLIFFPSTKNRRLPPGPPAVPVLGNLLWLRHSVTSNIEQLLKDLHAKHGPIITLRVGSRTSIFISDRSHRTLAHKALVEHGASFSDRPAPIPATRFLNSNQHSISSAPYGPLWRLFRRNLTAEILHSYVDSLLDIKLADEGGRWLTEDEVVTLCSEFFTAGTDTTATALQWIMAELVKHQGVQARLLEEIESVAGRSGGDELKEEDLQRMPFLKAVIMEGLRRHPPGHFVLPHSVKEDIEFEGFLIPKKASVNFLVAEINWEGWERRNEARVHGCSALDDFSPQKIHFLKEEYMFDHGNRSLLFSKEQNSSRAPHSAIEDERLMRDAESAISLWAGWLVN